MYNQERRYAVKKEERGREGKCSVQFQKRWKLSYPLFLEKEKEKASEKKKKRKREIENQNRDAFWDPKSTARVNQLNKQPIPYLLAASPVKSRSSCTIDCGSRSPS